MQKLNVTCLGITAWDWWLSPTKDSIGLWTMEIGRNLLIRMICKK